MDIASQESTTLAENVEQKSTARSNSRADYPDRLSVRFKACKGDNCSMPHNSRDKNSVGSASSSSTSKVSSSPTEKLNDNRESLSCRNVQCGICKETFVSPISTSNTEQKMEHLFDEHLTDSSHNSSMSRSYTPSFSSSDDDEDDDDAGLPGFHDFDDLDTLYSDWDSGLSINNSQDEDDWSLDTVGRMVTLVRTRLREGKPEEAAPLYPHRALMRHECQVCLTQTLLRRRVCCDFRVCAPCLSTYVSIKVDEAKVQIECPNDRCSVLLHRDEINERLPMEKKEKFARFLVNANADPCQKTCPACSQIRQIEPQLLNDKKKLKHGLQIQCGQCSLIWCFLCQAPYHTDMTCKQYRKGDKMVKTWAKELTAGQSNAQKCPKCNIFIQKVNGCDHMKCTKCNTDFCYRCGDRYISIKLLGNHWSKFSLFGCKYRLLPKRPALRRFIRGTNFAARLVAGVILASLGLAAGAVLVGASVVIVPGYGIFRLRRHLQMKEKRKKERSRESVNRFLGESHRVTWVPMCSQSVLNQPTDGQELGDQQVEAVIHRSISFSQEETEQAASALKEDFELYVNSYIVADDCQVVMSRIRGQDSDKVIDVSEVTEVQNDSGYPTVVAHIVSKMADDSDFTSKIDCGKPHQENDKNTNVSHSSGHSEGPADVEWDDTSSANLEGLTQEMITADSSSMQNVAPASDLCICSRENFSSPGGGGRVDSGYGEGEFFLDEEDCDKPLEDSVLAYEDKPSSNGCFGNIFSRRSQLDQPTTVKNPVPNLLNTSVKSKAGTWEKCSRDQMQLLLMSLPVDAVKAVSDWPSVHKEKPLKLARVFEGETGYSKSALTFPKSHELESASTLSRKNDPDTLPKSTFVGHLDEVDSVTSVPKAAVKSFRNATGPILECHVSSCNEVTYL